MTDTPPSHLALYNIGAEIGKGSFAHVYKGEYIPTHSSVAIKSVIRAKLSRKLLENLESEIAILKALKHPHIVSLIDCQQTSSNFLLIMEYCSLGDLSYFIRKRKDISSSLPLVASLFNRYPSPDGRGLHEDLARHFLQQLSSALQFLRDKNLVHRDIKPQNLLLCPPKKSQQEAIDAGYSGQWELPVLKLADFGFARILPNTSMAETLCGSPLYMAPEILRHEKYNAKADLWSVGAVLYEMVTGRPPFKANNHVELSKLIEESNDMITFPASNTSSPAIKQLIRSLLKKNPTERMGFTEFFNDPILTNEIPAENKPLDQSLLDERMFISEYIQKSDNNTHINKPLSPVVNTTTNPTPVSLSPSAPSTSTPHSAVTTIAPATLASVVTTTRTTPSPPPSSPKNTGSSLTSSPGSSLLVHNRDNPVIPASVPRTRFKVPLSANDSVEHEYVVVEKRTVEVNALADELAYSPKSGQEAMMIAQRRRSSSSRSAGSRPSSYGERRNSIAYGTSPTNALAKALTMASARLFGTRVNSSGETTVTTPPQFSQRSIPLSIDSEERRLIKELENLATKAKVVNLFAEVKFSQLVPQDRQEESQSSSGQDSNDPHSRSNNTDTGSGQSVDLAPETAVRVAEEALVLYVKTLSLLSKAMDKASAWWRTNENTGASLRLNNTVQWIREKFNESLTKAEYAQWRLKDIGKGSSLQSQDQTGYQKVASCNVYSQSSVTAEKLIFDRALEMSRAAAVNELVGEDLDGCELSYGTAVWMFEALLESDAQEEVLDCDDKATVERFVTSISRRLSTLRRKREVLNSAAVVSPVTTSPISPVKITTELGHGDEA